jgi:hypothetical protein
MAQATGGHIRSRAIPLSSLFTDPVFRPAFRRAEDSGAPFMINFAVPPDRPRPLEGRVAQRMLPDRKGRAVSAALFRSA